MKASARETATIKKATPKTATCFIRCGRGGGNRGVGDERGAATLAITLLLFFVMALVATFVNRNLIFEQRISANQYRSTQAFEAAEAGLQWAEAQLNSNQRLRADCTPATDAAATSFRQRYLGFASGTGLLTPRTWDNGGMPSTLQPACVRASGGWSCSCPAQGVAVLSAPGDDGPSPAFSLQFLAGNKPGTVRLVATGCSALAAPCGAGGATAADATARVEVSLGVLGALRVPPAAALTTAGSVDADSAAFRASNGDAATGIAIHAGGDIAASHASLSGVAGAPASAMRVANDSALAALGADRFFASYFGIDKPHWRDQPAVTRVTCSRDCAATLAQAIDDRASSAMLWVDGDLDLVGATALGAADQPVVIVVNGAVRLRGPVAIQGVLYAASVAWDEPGSGAQVNGALIVEGRYSGTGTPRVSYDPQVLAALTGFGGSFARISGSWRDF